MHLLCNAVLQRANRIFPKERIRALFVVLRYENEGVGIRQLRRPETRSELALAPSDARRALGVRPARRFEGGVPVGVEAREGGREGGREAKRGACVSEVKLLLNSSPRGENETP